MAPNAHWNVDPKEDINDPFGAFAPYDRVHILNMSEYDIEVRINGSPTDRALIHGGGHATYEAENMGELFNYVEIINVSAHTIPANKIEVNLGGASPENKPALYKRLRGEI